MYKNKVKQIFRIFLAVTLFSGSGVALFDVLTNNMLVSATTDNNTHENFEGSLEGVTANINEVTADTKVNGNAALSANNFTISLADAARLTFESSKIAADAMAWNLDTDVDFTYKVKPNYDQLRAIVGATTIGAYALEFSVQEESGTPIVHNTITVSIIDNNTVISNNEALHAYNFIIDKSEVATLEDVKVIMLAEAKAWQLSDGSSLNLTVDYSGVLDVPGTYQAVFSTEAGTTKTINITVTDNDTVITDDEAIYAHSFTVNSSEVGSLTDADVTAKAEARAWNTDDQSVLAVHVDYSSIEAKVGAYPVIFTTDNGTTHTVYASVIDDNTVVTDGVAIYATDFNIKTQQVAELNDAQVRAYTNFKAWLTRGGQDISAQFTVDYSQVKTTTGSYPVTFSYTFTDENGEEVTVTKTVLAHVTADSELPITGGNEFELGLIGLLSVIVGAALIIRRKNQ